MVVQRKIDELLAIRASEWVDLLPTASPQQLRELEGWLSQSKLHVQEFLEVAEVEFALGGLDRTRQYDVDAMISRLSSNVTSLASHRVSAPARTTSRPRWQAFAMAASVAALAIVAAFVMRSPSVDEQLYATQIGELRTIELADGSVVAMNADSELKVTLASTARDLQLVRGEATFEVAHDSSRPFSVHTAAGTVVAVGTKFNVRNRLNGDTSVDLLEGRVRIASDSAEMFLNAGEAADIRLEGTIERRMDAVVQDSTGWQKNRLAFEDATLEEIVAEFNRHNPSLRLRLEGVDGRQYRYAGVFNANDPNELADILSREPGLSVERRPGEIVIRRKAR